ncbi:MAG: hypothetical protein ABSE48_15965 [Verrucomicrobiota bacterium]
MASLKEKTRDLLENLKRIENKQIALRAAIERSKAQLDAIQSVPIIVEKAFREKLLTPKPHRN